VELGVMRQYLLEHARAVHKGDFDMSSVEHGRPFFEVLNKGKLGAIMRHCH
jgi:hypothetical protein